MKRNQIKLPKGYDGLLELLAKQMGVDLLEEADRIGLTSWDVENLMQRCVSCTDHRGCRTELSLPGDAPVSPPGFCINRKLLLHLKDRLEAAKAAEAKNGEKSQ